MRILITDCDHDSIDFEREVVEGAGGRLDLVQTKTPAEVIAAVKELSADGNGPVEGLVVQYAQIDAEVLDALPGIKVLSRYGVGVDTLDVPAATARKVAICNVPDYGTEAVSDHAIALTLGVTRGLGALDRGIRGGSHSLASSLPVRLYGNQTFGVIGCGLIGSAAARKADALGYRVIVHDIRFEEGSTTPQGWPVVSREEVLRTADVISLHTPLTEETYHLIDADALALTKPGVIIVNTSRGGVLDTNALLEALESGQVHGAGLDVLEEEPVPADHPLTRFERVILTPHSAFYSEESYAELKRRTAENAVDVLLGKRPRNLLNPEILEG